MRIQISARHVDLPDTVRARTEELIGRLTRYESRLSAAEVIFDIQGHLKKVEGILSIDRDEPVVATGEGDEFRGALDQLVDRLGKILRRRHDQRKDHQAKKLSEAVAQQE